MRYVILVVLIAFSAFSVWVTAETSYLGAFPPFGDLNTLQIFVDLAIAGSLVILLVYRRCEAREKPVWPVAALLVGTALLGSIALLAYFVIDPEPISAPGS